MSKKRKYEKGQTWPVGAFKAGLQLTWTDKELRGGIPAHKSVEDPNTTVRKYINDFDYIRVPSLKTIKYTFFPAGKPLKTDTQIRKYRRKAIGNRTQEEANWTNSSVAERKYYGLKDPFKWRIR